MNTLTTHAPVLADGGIIDWAINTTGDIGTLLGQVAIVVVVLFIVMAAIRSKMSMAPIIVAIIVGALLLWAVNNPEVISNEFAPDLPGAMSTTQLGPGLSA